MKPFCFFVLRGANARNVGFIIKGVGVCECVEDDNILGTVFDVDEVNSRVDFMPVSKTVGVVGKILVDVVV